MGTFWIDKLTQQRFVRSVLIGALLCGVTSLTLFGIIGVGRSGHFASGDFAVMYGAGVDWLTGGNPYIVPESESPFAYPPNSAFFFVPLALLDLSISRYGMLLLNLSAIAAIIVATCQFIRERIDDRGNLRCLLVAAFVVGNPFTTHVVWMGQTSLIVLAFMVWAWRLREANWLLAGICLGFASLKPQLSILLFVWFLLERNWKSLAAAGATFLAMSYYPLLNWGPVKMMSAWLGDGIGGYLSSDANTAGFQHLVGVESMLAAAGIDAPSFKIVGVLLTGVLWAFRDRLHSADILGILFGISLTFVYGHDYDYVCLSILLTSLVVRAKSFPRLWIPLGILTFLLCIPQRLLRPLDIPVLNHWRTPVVIALTVLALFASWQQPQQRTELSESVVPE